jgi:hypothetical protein
MMAFEAPRGDLASTLARRFNLAAGGDFRRVSHDALMEESERCLSWAAHGGAGDDELVATRILENAHDFQTWEAEHSGLMRRIAAERLPAAQKSALLSTALALIHRKALFEYLRDREVRGQSRRRLMAHFSADRDYEASMVSEHGRYLRSAASFLCSSHVGKRLMFDTLFDEPLAQYEELYKQYFRTYCDFVLMSPGDATYDTTNALLAPMKEQVREWRNALLALTHSQSGTWRRPNF